MPPTMDMATRQARTSTADLPACRACPGGWRTSRSHGLATRRTPGRPRQRHLPAAGRARLQTAATRRQTRGAHRKRSWRTLGRPHRGHVPGTGRAGLQMATTRRGTGGSCRKLRWRTLGQPRRGPVPAASGAMTQAAISPRWTRGSCRKLRWRIPGRLRRGARPSGRQQLRTTCTTQPTKALLHELNRRQTHGWFRPGRLPAAGPAMTQTAMPPRWTRGSCRKLRWRIPGRPHRGAGSSGHQQLRTASTHQKAKATFQELIRRTRGWFRLGRLPRSGRPDLRATTSPWGVPRGRGPEPTWRTPGMLQQGFLPAAGQRWQQTGDLSQRTFEGSCRAPPPASSLGFSAGAVLLRPTSSMYGCFLAGGGSVSQQVALRARQRRRSPCGRTLGPASAVGQPLASTVAARWASLSVL